MKFLKYDLITICLVLFLICWNNSSSFAQCKCPNNNEEWPPGNASTIDCDIFEVLDIEIRGGQYNSIYVEYGNEYTFSTCSGASYDTQLTLYDINGLLLAHNDDDCSLQSRIKWTATFSGVIKILLDEYVDSEHKCQSNNTNTTIEVWCNSACTDNDNEEFPIGSIGAVICDEGYEELVTGITAGQHHKVAVEKSKVYSFRTSSDNSFNNDTQLTLYDSDDILLAYNDDYNNGLLSQVTWKSTFNGVIKVLLNEYDCQNNSTGISIDGRCRSLVDPCLNDSILCYTLCDQGGRLIDYRELVNDSLVQNDLAPPSLYTDPCIQDAYCDYVPEQLYADIFIMYYDGGPFLSTDFVGNGEEDIKYFIYQCVACDEGECTPVCMGQVTNDFCDNNPTCLEEGIYYVVAVSEFNTNYSFTFATLIIDCFIDSTVLANCNHTINDSVDLDNNLSSLSYQNCSNGSRLYNGNDKGYLITIDQPTLLNIAIDAVEPMGVFVFQGNCETTIDNCLVAIENPDVGGSAILDSIPLSEGEYFLVVDKAAPGGNENFTLNISCVPDSTYIYNIWGSEVSEDCEVNENNTHDLNINGSAYNFTNKHLITYGVYDGNDIRPIEGQSRFWTEGANLIQFGIPQDGPGGDKCSYITNDSFLLYLYDTKEGNMSGGRVDISFLNSSTPVSFSPGEVNTITKLEYFDIDHFGINQKIFSIDNSGSQDKFIISTDQSWEVFKDQAIDWITLNNLTGNGPQVYYFDVAPNEFPVPREAMVEVHFGATPPVIREVSIRQIENCSNLPNLSLIESSTQICNESSLTLEVIDEDELGDVFLYDWSSNVIDSGAVVTLSPGVSTIYSVTVTNKYCTQQDPIILTKQITVIDNPIANAGVDMELDCNTINLTLNGNDSAPGSGGTLSYEWTGPGIISGSTSANPIVNLPGMYQLVVTELPSGCTSESSVLVSSIPSPVASISNSFNLQCFEDGSGQATTFITGGTPPFSYNWCNGEITSSATNLSAGLCNVTVIDGLGCTAITNVNLTQPTEINISGNSIGVNCGEENGAIDISINGGSGAYTYLWTPGGSTQQDQSNLSPGNYTVLVTDASGCTATFSETVNSTSGPSPITTVTNVSCYDFTDGFIDLTVSQGAPPYTYLWSNGSITEDIMNLEPGTYSVTITDNTGCTVVTSDMISEPMALTISGTISPAFCSSSTGNVVISIMDGTTPYSFQWSNGAQTQNIENVIAGTYVVTVTDNNDCTTTETYEVEAISNLAATSNPVNPSCFGLSDGSINLTVSDGTAPFTFIWSNGATVEDPQNLIAGTYTVTIVDAVGCEFVELTTLVESDELEFTAEPSNACFDQCDGSVLLNATGGEGPYSYTIDNGADLNNLCEGSYSLTVTDNNGCTVVDANAFIILEESELAINVDATTNEFQDSLLGSANVTIEGGSPPYSVEWVLNGTTISTTEDPSDLPQGTYTLIITDVNLCVLNHSVNIGFVSGINTITQNKISIDVIPNPAKGVFNLVLSGPINDLVNVKVFDAIGKAIYQKQQLAERGLYISFDLSSYAKGIYFVQLSFVGESITKRIVIQ